MGIFELTMTVLFGTTAADEGTPLDETTGADVAEVAKMEEAIEEACPTMDEACPTKDEAAEAISEGTPGIAGIDILRESC